MHPCWLLVILLGSAGTASAGTIEWTESVTPKLFELQRLVEERIADPCKTLTEHGCSYCSTRSRFPSGSTYCSSLAQHLLPCGLGRVISPQLSSVRHAGVPDSIAVAVGFEMEKLFNLTQLAAVESYEFLTLTGTSRRVPGRFDNPDDLTNHLGWASPHQCISISERNTPRFSFPEMLFDETTFKVTISLPIYVKLDNPIAQAGTKPTVAAAGATEDEALWGVVAGHLLLTEDARKDWSITDEELANFVKQTRKKTQYVVPHMNESHADEIPMASHCAMYKYLVNSRPSISNCTAYTRSTDTHTDPLWCNTEFNDAFETELYTDIGCCSPSWRSTLHLAVVIVTVIVCFIGIHLITRKPSEKERGGGKTQLGDPELKRAESFAKERQGCPDIEMHPGQEAAPAGSALETVQVEEGYKSIAPQHIEVDVERVGSNLFGTPANVHRHLDDEEPGAPDLDGACSILAEHVDVLEEGLETPLHRRLRTRTQTQTYPSRTNTHTHPTRTRTHTPAEIHAPIILSNPESRGSPVPPEQIVISYPMDGTDPEETNYASSEVGETLREPLPMQPFNTGEMGFGIEDDRGRVLTHDEAYSHGANISKFTTQQTGQVPGTAGLPATKVPDAEQEDNRMTGGLILPMAVELGGEMVRDDYRIISLEPILRLGEVEIRNRLMRMGFQPHNIKGIMEGGLQGRKDGFRRQDFLAATFPEAEQSRQGDLIWELFKVPAGAGGSSETEDTIACNEYLALILALCPHSDADGNSIKAAAMFHLLDWGGDSAIDADDVRKALDYSLKHCRMKLSNDVKEDMIRVFMGDNMVITQDMFIRDRFNYTKGGSNAVGGRGIVGGPGYGRRQSMPKPIPPARNLGGEMMVPAASEVLFSVNPVRYPVSEVLHPMPIISTFRTQFLVNYRIFLSWFLFASLNAAFIFPVYKLYMRVEILDTFSYGMAMARISARFMLVNFPILFFLMDRRLHLARAIAWIPSQLNRWMHIREPAFLFSLRRMFLDCHLSWHKSLGWMLLYAMVIHTVAHLFNAYMASIATPMQLFLSTHEKFPRNPPPKITDILFRTFPGISGIIALFVFGVLYFFARKSMRTKYHHLFYWTHRFGWMLGLLALLFHELPFIVNFWKWMVLWPAVPWGAVAFFGIPLFPSYLSGKLVALFYRQKRSKLVSFTDFGGSMALEVKVNGKFQYSAGAFAWINFPEVDYWEWHPFTLTSAPSDKDILMFHIREMKNRQAIMKCLKKERDPWTKKMMKYLRCQAESETGGESSSSPKAKKAHKFTKNIRCHIDGPYPAPTMMTNDPNKDNTLVLIGQGVGVTPFASVLRDLLGTNNTIKYKNLVVVWVSPDHSNFSWFTEVLKSGMQTSSIRIFIYNTTIKETMYHSILKVVHGYYFSIKNVDPLTDLKYSMKFGRPKWEQFFGDLRMDPEFGAAGFDVFVCGAGVFAEGIEATAKAYNLIEFQRLEELKRKDPKTTYSPAEIKVFSENFG